MTYDRQYGKREGLAERLIEHIKRLGTDRTLPWVGLGLIDDLYAASAAISGKAEKKIVEYDL